MNEDTWWIVLARILGAFLLLNLFAYGMWLIYGGLRRRKYLSKLRKVPAKLAKDTNRSLQAHLEWRHRNQDHWGVSPYMYTLFGKDTVSLYLINDLGTQYEMNMWYANGRGKIFAGSSLLAIASFFTIILF